MGTLSFATFEDLRASVYRVEYKPSGVAQASVYRLTMDAPTWSTDLLPVPRPLLSGSRLTGQPLTVTWPVYEMTGSVTISMRPMKPPLSTIYFKSWGYATGSLVTDPLPSGFGTVDLDVKRDLTGASTHLDLISGPPTDLAPSGGVSYFSWQASGFAITPEPGALAWAMIGGFALAARRRRACAR